ncbi:MAG: hypothetical protein QM710_13730 [Flavobacterium sp.]
MKKQKIFLKKRELAKFPFSKSTQIKLISLKSKSEEIVGQDLIKHIDSIRIGKDIFKPEFYTEVATLNTAQTNELTNVIFNYTYKKKPYSISAANCYMPRNAILFLDNNNVIIAYLEFCFSCDGFRTSSKDFGIGEYCSEKYEMIKAIFKESEIVYGITETEEQTSR